MKQIVVRLIDFHYSFPDSHAFFSSFFFLPTEKEQFTVSNRLISTRTQEEDVVIEDISQEAVSLITNCLIAHALIYICIIHSVQSFAKRRKTLSALASSTVCCPINAVFWMPDSLSSQQNLL